MEDALRDELLKWPGVTIAGRHVEVISGSALGIGWVKSILPYQFRAHYRKEELWLESLSEITHDLFYLENHWLYFDFAFSCEDDAVAFKIAHSDEILHSWHIHT